METLILKRKRQKSITNKIGPPKKPQISKKQPQNKKIKKQPQIKKSRNERFEKAILSCI
jgi:hypothetical protein